MAIVGQDIAGKDVYGKMDGFMSSRESLAAQPNVLAFMDAAQNNKQYIPFSSGAVLSQADMLLLKSGHVMAPLHSRAAAEGETSSGNSEEAEREKDAHMTRAMVNAITAQTMTYDGMTFTYEEVDGNLTKAIEQQEKFLERELREVKKEDLLYVDGNGRIVPADTPGARQVMTPEEKADVENRNHVCTGQFSANEVTFQNGKLVPTKDAETNMATQDEINDMKNVREEVRNGRRDLGSIPDHMKAHIKEVGQTGSIAAAKPGLSVFEQLKHEEAISQLKNEYPQGHQPKMEVAAPAPVRDFTPAPGM
jgi:hypothetical protein